MPSLRRSAALSLKVVACMLTAVALLLLVAPPVLGWRLQMVLSGSMAPVFDTGSVIAVQPVSAASVQAGDVVSFRRPSGPPITHRVLEVQGTGSSVTFITKGDANEDIDPNPIPASAVIGEVTAYVPHLGYVAHFMRQPLGFVLLVALPGFALLLGELRSIIRPTATPTEKAVAT